MTIIILWKVGKPLKLFRLTHGFGTICWQAEDCRSNRFCRRRRASEMLRSRRLCRGLASGKTRSLQHKLATAENTKQKIMFRLYYYHICRSSNLLWGRRFTSFVHSGVIYYKNEKPESLQNSILKPPATCNRTKQPCRHYSRNLRNCLYRQNL